MSKITITIEDTEKDLVAVKAEPTFEKMLKGNIAGNPLTSAEGYAISALLHIRAAAKKQKKKGLALTLPKVKHPY